MTGLALNESAVTPGALGALIVAALAVALFFLIRSMNKQIRRIEAPREEDLRQARWEEGEQERERPRTGDRARDGGDGGD